MKFEHVRIQSRAVLGAAGGGCGERTGARIEFKRMLIREMEVIRVNYEVKRRPNDL